MNGDGLPYEIDASQDTDGPRVVVRWTQEELRRRTFSCVGRG